MAEWNAYYRNEDDEEGQDEGEEAGGETRAAVAQRCVLGSNKAKSCHFHPCVLLMLPLCYSSHLPSHIFEYFTFLSLEFSLFSHDASMILP